MAYIRQSRPDSVLGFPVKTIKTFKGVASLLGSGLLKPLEAGAHTPPSPGTGLPLLSSFHQFEVVLVLGLLGFRYLPGANPAWFCQLLRMMVFSSSSVLLSSLEMSDKKVYEP